MSGDSARRRIYSVILRIPRGRVATYGQVARLAGMPGHARLVGYTLAALADGDPAPWHRVINAEGRISARSGEGPMEILQKLRLERERIVFDGRGAISLAKFQWRPSANRA